MSTVINNAFRLHTSKASELEKVNEKIRSMLSEMQKQKLFSHIANQFIKYHIEYMGTDIHAHYTKNQKNIGTFLDFELLFNTNKTHSDAIKYLSKNLKYYDDNFMTWYKELVHMIGEHDFAVSMNKNITVSFKTVGNYTYYILFSRDHDIISQFRNRLSEIHPKFITYDYWNNTDQPENISVSAWKNREKQWDIIFSNSSTPRECMNQINIVPITYSIKLTDIFHYIPDDFELLKTYFEHQVVDIYCQEELDLLKAQGLPESIGRCSRKAEERVKAEIENGYFLKYKDDFINKGFSRDALLQKFVNEELDMGKES